MIFLLTLLLTYLCNIPPTSVKMVPAAIAHEVRVPVFNQNVVLRLMVFQLRHFSLEVGNNKALIIRYK